jgi:hypothetical protein
MNRLNLFKSSVNRCLNITHRYLSVNQRPETIPNVFDRQAKLKQRERTCRDPDYQVYSYIHERVAQSLVDRIFDIKRYDRLLKHNKPMTLSMFLEHFNRHSILAVVVVLLQVN